MNGISAQVFIFMFKMNIQGDDISQAIYILKYKYVSVLLELNSLRSIARGCSTENYIEQNSWKLFLNL